MNWRSMEIMLSNGQNKQQVFIFILSTFEKGSASNYCTWTADHSKMFLFFLPTDYKWVIKSRVVICPSLDIPMTSFLCFQLFEIEWIKNFSSCLGTERKQSKPPPASHIASCRPRVHWRLCFPVQSPPKTCELPSTGWLTLHCYWVGSFMSLLFLFYFLVTKGC